MRYFGALDGQKEVANNDHSRVRCVFIHCRCIRVSAFNIVTVNQRYLLDSPCLPKYECIPDSRRHQNRTLGVDWRGKYFVFCTNPKLELVRRFFRSLV